MSKMQYQELIHSAHMTCNTSVDKHGDHAMLAGAGLPRCGPEHNPPLLHLVDAAFGV